MNYIIDLLNKLHEVAYNILFVLITPALLLVLLTRKIVIDAKNKIITLNK
jgi:hypothetical protein